MENLVERVLVIIHFYNLKMDHVVYVGLNHQKIAKNKIKILTYF